MPAETPSKTRTQIGPREAIGPDRLIRTLSNSGTIGVKVIVASELVAECLSRRTIAATAGDALGRAMMGAVLIGGAIKPWLPIFVFLFFGGLSAAKRTAEHLQSQKMRSAWCRRKTDTP